MSAKRKDKKGRVLRTGESQRKDLTYQYRYTDSSGKRHTVYAPTLDGLRKKEKEIPLTSGCPRDALQRMIANRKKPDIEYCVDGYSGFLLLDKNRKEI